MASSSYTNCNVEACYVPEDKATGEKTTNGHGEAPDKHTRASRLQLYASFLLHVVSFTALIWVIVQVVQLRNETTTVGGTVWYDDENQHADSENVKVSDITFFQIYQLL